MGIYLNEAGAHTKYINKEYEKFNKYRNKANELEKIANGSPSGQKIRNKANEYVDKARDVSYNVLGRYGNMDDLHKFANRHHNDIDNTNRYNNKYIKHKLGAGKDNMPKDRKPGTYLKAQNKLRGIKEACEYILDMLDEEYYYDEYED